MAETFHSRAFQRSTFGGFLRSPFGNRNRGEIYPIMITGATQVTGPSKAGTGMRNYRDEYDSSLVFGDPGYGDKLVEQWQNQGANLASRVNYDSLNAVYSFVSIAAEPSRIRMTDRDGTTVWTRQLTEAANAVMYPAFIRGDKVFYVVLDSATATWKYKAVDRATGATVLWTANLTSAHHPFGWWPSRGMFYVDSNQDSYFTCCYLNSDTGNPPTGGFVRLIKFDASGSQIFDTIVASTTLASGQAYECYDNSNGYLVPIGNEFVIGYNKYTVGTGVVNARGFLKIAKDGSLSMESTGAPYNIIVKHATASRLYGNPNGFTTAWFDASGNFIDSVNAGGFAAIGSMSPTETSGEIYVAGAVRSGATTGRVIRLNTTTKATVFTHDLITTGAEPQVMNMVTRPWPA